MRSRTVIFDGAHAKLVEAPAYMFRAGRSSTERDRHRTICDQLGGAKPESASFLTRHCCADVPALRPNRTPSARCGWNISLTA